MNKKRLIMITLIVLLIICIGIGVYLLFNDSMKGVSSGIMNSEQVGNTNKVPRQYKDSANEQGKIVKVEYETYDYTSDSKEKITKPAYVYLPYGYDENDTETKYDILYMMHGWTGTAEMFFNETEGLSKNIVDNLIKNKDIKPIIIVSATFDAENEPQEFSRSVEEIAVFNNDFRNELVPYIESHFNTYAEGTSEEDFQNSREHRAFSGFSLGAVTTWYQFVYNLDYIKYYFPMSGDSWILGTYGGLNQPKETNEYLENVVKNSKYGEEDFFIYSATGTSDAVFKQVDNQMQEMLKSDVFTAKNFYYGIKINGLHNFDACDEYVYNALPYFFSNEK